MGRIRIPCLVLWVFLVGVTALLNPALTSAQGVIVVDPPRCEAGCPEPFPIGDQIEIRSHRVDVTVRDGVASTRVDQVFRNPNDWVAEGTYLFPVPEGAAVSELKMWVDGEPVTAELLDAAEARRVYDEIVRRLRDPALLEYAGAGAVQASVFPIPPGEERRIEIEYAEVLAAEGGLTRYRYGLSGVGGTASQPEQVSVRVAVESSEPIRVVYSPSHAVAVDREGDHRFVAGFEAGAEPVAADFELFYGASTEAIGADVVSYYDPIAGDGTFLLLAAPGVEAATEVVAKDVVLVLDTSGSMEGEKIVQARDALTYVLEHLNPEDRFNVVEFSTGARLFEESMQPVARAAEAAEWVGGLAASGGTDINLALLEAMAMADGDRPTTLLFLTDGLPTEGEVEIGRILANVAATAPANVRLFAFGVGDDVDTTLLDSLAEAHHGATTYVRPGEAVDEAVSTFYAGVSDPVLTDVQVDVAGVRVEDVYPTPLPDLFAGGQLVVLGRYREGGTATVTLTGLVDGREQTFVYADRVFASAGGEESLPRLWATRKIGHLLNAIRLGGEDPELVSAIVDLSVRFGIVTPYTSYLITEEEILTQAGRAEAVTAAQERMMETAAPVSGAEAVERADASNALAEAEVAAAPVANADGAEVVRVVGARAFVLREEVWTETTFDPSTMTATRVPFASEAYFRLLDEHPALAAPFALGQRVVAVADGQAYEVVP